jgi:hypothetical protein
MENKYITDKLKKAYISNNWKIIFYHNDKMDLKLNLNIKNCIKKLFNKIYNIYKNKDNMLFHKNTVVNKYKNVSCKLIVNPFKLKNMTELYGNIEIEYTFNKNKLNVYSKIFFLNEKIYLYNKKENGLCNYIIENEKLLKLHKKNKKIKKKCSELINKENILRYLLTREYSDIIKYLSENNEKYLRKLIINEERKSYLFILEEENNENICITTNINIETLKLNKNEARIRQKIDNTEYLEYTLLINMHNILIRPTHTFINSINSINLTITIINEDIFMITIEFEPNEPNEPKISLPWMKCQLCRKDSINEYKMIKKENMTECNICCIKTLYFIKHYNCNDNCAVSCTLCFYHGCNE